MNIESHAASTWMSTFNAMKEAEPSEKPPRAESLPKFGTTWV